MSGGVLAWLSGTRCRLAYGPADATAHTVSCFSKIQIGFTFLVPAHPGSPGKRAVKRVYVCVCITGSQLPITTSQPAKYCSGEASKENANMGQNAQPYKSHGVVNHDLCTLLSVYFS